MFQYKSGLQYKSGVQVIPSLVAVEAAEPEAYIRSFTVTAIWIFEKDIFIQQCITKSSGI